MRPFLKLTSALVIGLYNVLGLTGANKVLDSNLGIPKLRD